MPNDPLDLERIELPPLPEVVAELLSMMGQDSLHGAYLARVVSRDPVLAGATLKLANSSFFGLAGRIGGMQDAIVLIGVNAVRNMLLILGMRNALKPASDRFDTHGFWLHALETAAAARELARARGLCGDEAFLAGLMHDLGKLLIACTAPAQLVRIDAHRQAEGGTYAEAEAEVGGVDHECAGDLLARAWALPDVLARAMSRHHAPSADDADLAHVVHLANLLAHLAQGEEATEPAPRLQPISWQRLSPSEEDLSRALKAVRRLRRRSGEWRSLLERL
ncbi:MAG: HDOD domain-containing protein [Pseudomonadota bacterium]